jgi:hypothetical protein
MINGTMRSANVLEPELDQMLPSLMIEDTNATQESAREPATRTIPWSKCHAVALLLVISIGVSFGMLGGCAVSRSDQLHRKADRVGSALEKERDRVVAMSEGSADRSGRIQHLTTLRNQLSAANVGLGTVRLLPPETRDTAYDVLDQAYDTIKWNIPLGPADPKRALPLQFSDGVLRLN